MSDIRSFFNSMPFFTRYWFGLSIIFPLLSRFGLLNPGYLILDYYAVIGRFQIWRPITAVFYYPLGPSTAFAFLLNLYFLYNYSTRLETGVFSGRPADYCFLLLFSWASLVVISLLCNIWLLMDPMILCVLYIWCQLNRDVIISFWFGSQFKAVYLPWVLFGFNFILRGGGFDELIGILVGHAYFFVMYKYPEMYRRNLIQTPQILYEYFPNQRGGATGFGIPPAARAPQNDDRRHTWGRGRVLGE